MRIRNCRQKDFSLLMNMDWSPLPTERDTIYLILAVEQADTSFIAEDDTGSWQGVLLASRSSNGISCYINHLIVSSQERGKGIGSALVEHLIGRCRSLGIQRIWLLSRTEIKKFYEKLGFKEDESFLEASVADYIYREKKHLVMKIDL